MDTTFLANTPLFQGTTPDEITAMLRCLDVVRKSCQKGEYLYHAGDFAQNLGILLSGGINIESDDLWGNKSILNHVFPGQIFAEAYASVPGEPLMVSVVADEPSEVLMVNVARILHTCPSSCEHHNRLIRNLLAVTAQKNLNLSRRILHTSAKTIRRRILSYLSFEASRQGSGSVAIPFNRQQLADYLNVDRSALSNELSKMRRDGILTVNKNHFTLKEDLS
ncbi:MAG: Crp/Fnr family transcriptional regulator [Lachnospiraceae bacterium]|nr:Crp/Fnr family transcriptional regulator [Lachnospiraceae bacterium]